MCAIIKAKCLQQNITVCECFGGRAVYNHMLACHGYMHAECDVSRLKQSYHYIIDCNDLNDLCESNEYNGLIDLLFSPLVFSILMVLPT